MTQPNETQPHVIRLSDADATTADTPGAVPGTGHPVDAAEVRGLPELAWRGAQEWICGFAVCWPDAPGWYQIDWGDDTTEIAHRDLPARRHSYTISSACANLTHTVTVRELYRDGTTSPVRAQAVVQARGRGNPAHRFSLYGAGGRTVQASLSPWEEPRGFTVAWGDDTPLEHLPDGARTATHTYTTNAGGSFTPAIGLLDRPARRVAWFTGPTITETTREKSLSTLSATFTAPSQWWGGYSANYRVTNRGQQATSWELSFFLSAPARVEDVWGAGQLKRPTERQHRGGKPGQPTDPPLALYANPQMAGTPVAAAVSADVSAEAGSGGAGGAGATTAYVIKCTQPLPPGASVDVGFRVESGQQNTPMPGHCSINGSPCAGTGPTPPEPDKDTQPPSRPTDVTVTHAGPRTIGLSWTEATDDTAVRKYEIAVDGDVTVEVPAPATGGTVTRLNPHTQYQLTVRAVDAAGNTGLWSDPVTGLTTEDTPQADKPWLARVAPFVDMGLWPTPQLAEFAAESGLNAFNLGFIVALENTDPTPVWAGQATYAVKDGWQKDNIVGFGAGGTRHAVISFGGETGTELAIAAKDTETAYQQYKLVIDTYGFGDGPHHIDFDIEGAAQKNQAANERRAAAVARLQREYPDLRVSWTLPVLPEGLVPDGLNVLRTAQAAGVRIDLVNIMAMVFYRQEDMGQLVRSAMENTHRQLAEFFPGVTAKERWAKLSVCPMIGMNNDRAIYSLDHAKQTTDFAIERGLGQITYWEAGRDRNACLSEALFQCTAIPQQPWDFARRFIAYQNTAVKKAPAGKAGD